MSTPLPPVLEYHSPGNPCLAHLRDSVVCPVLYHMFLVRLNSLAVNHHFSFADTVPFIQYGVRTFGLSIPAAWGLLGGGFLVARVIHCAAHGIDLATRAAQFIPAHLPIDALRQVGLPMPSISLLLSYPDNPFLRRRFPTRLAAIRAAERFSDWVQYNIFWLAECILRSRVKGPFSAWDFGAILGMTKGEFLRRITAAHPSPPTAQAIFPRTEGIFYYTALDLEIAQLIRPWYTHAGVLEGPTQIGAALYPVDHHLAGPMDVIMSTGFERMEEDYTDAADRVRTAGEGIYDGTLGF
ncbi:hypothetical protein DFH09DRAFT_1364819 [Mycena vulgaris]|nr:hypothetical protein DFH09DRAFT_1289696 [Mycena vulgaris]KAJ6559441.1 hypothetical protein DFH09DRAFT_1364819 [Mycena vulgaris]